MVQEDHMARPHKIWFRMQTGWWMVKIAGKQTKLAEGKKNKKVAQDKFHELMTARTRLPESGDARVADIVEAFLKWSRINQAPDTRRLHGFYGQSFADACGNLLMSELKPFHVSRWVDKKVEKGIWGETTVYNARRTAFRIMSWAKQEGVLKENPLTGMKKPQPMPRQRALKPEEFWAIYNAAADYFQDFILGLQLTGMRPKEARDLTWDQVQEDRIILQNKTRRQTGKATRTVMLTAAMKDLLAKRRAMKEEFVFTDSRGNPWNPNSIRQQFKRLKEKLKLRESVCSYLVRHMFGTQAILNGVDC